MNKEYCEHYCGVTCIDGTCPKALEDEYMERGIEVPVNCANCWYYKGCEDCAFCSEDGSCEVEKKCRLEENSLRESK